MTETFNEDVLIDGSEDVAQLRVQGHSTQLEPLQNWEDAAGEPLARVTGSGKLQIGDLSLSTPAALVEASADLTSSSAKPQRGVHALGRFTGALADALTWAVHELELAGSGGISALQTAFRAKITNKNTGTVSSSQFRAGDFQAVNEKGGSGNAVEQITALRGAASNAANAHTAKAVGVEVVITNDSGGVLNQAVAVEVAPPNNSGTLQTLYGLRIADLNQGTDNYAIYTGEGVVHLGDHQELRLESTAPSANPPGDFIKVYPKLLGDTPALFAKDSSGTETLIRGIDNNALHTNGVGEITTLSEKTTPHADDIFVIEDSEDSHTKKRMKASNLLGNDENALHTNEAGEIAALTEKTTPQPDDWLLIEDNEDSDNKKKVKLGSLIAEGLNRDLYVEVTGTDAVNTDDEIALLVEGEGNTTIPANTLAVGVAIEIEAWGYVQTYNTDATLPQFIVKVGGVSVLSCDQTIEFPANMDHEWRLRAIITCDTGSSNNIVLKAKGYIEFLTWSDYSSTGRFFLDSLGGSLDIEEPHDVEINFTWDVADANNWFQLQGAYIRLIDPNATGGSSYGNSGSFSGDADDVPYTPTTSGDWSENPDPTTVEEALDYLAARGASTFSGDADDVPYTPTTSGDWPGPDPTNVEAGLDRLAERLTDLAALGVSFIPGTSGAWTTAPDTVQGALDELGARSGGSFSGEADDVPYTPDDTGDWGEDPDPVSVQEALDMLAARPVGTGSGNIITVGVYSTSRPSFPNSGDMFIPTDGFAHEIYHNSLWNPYWNGRKLVRPPVKSNWTETNMGTASLSDDKGTLLLLEPNSSGDNLRLVTRSVPVAPYKCTVLATFVLHHKDFQQSGIALRDSSSGKVKIFGPHRDGNVALKVTRFSSLTNWDGQDDVYPNSLHINLDALWLRIEDDGTDRIYSYSNDGEYFTVARVEENDEYLVPNQIGFVLTTNNSDDPYTHVMRVRSWEED